MSTIPLPALHLNPPPTPPDPLEQYAKIQQLRNQATMQPLQQQAAQQQVQSGALDLQEKQIQLKDQQAMQAAMQQWSQPKSTTPPSASTLPGAPGGQLSPLPTAASASPSAMPSYDDLIDLAKKNGASFKTIQGLQSQILDMKDKASTIAKNDAQTGSDNAATMIKKNGMIVDAIQGITSQPDNQLVPALTQTVQQLQAQGLLDPQHLQLVQQLAQSGNPQAIRQQLGIYANSLGGQSKIQEDALKQIQIENEKGKTNPNSPLYAPSEQAVAAGTAPLAGPIQAGQVKQGAARAAADEKARLSGEMALAAQRQALSQGDPSAAAKLLVNGDATLSELKARGSTPEFIASTLQAAHQMSGGQYNAQAADAQYSVAKSPAQVQFFGSAKSLTDKGGTLDQLAEAAKKIPQNQIPAFNSLEDWAKAAAGSGPLAEYASRVLGVADDYSKVMGGGSGSDTSRLQAANLISAKLSAEGRAGAIAGIRGSVGSQINSRIGSNPVLQRMYGTNSNAVSAQGQPNFGNQPGGSPPTAAPKSDFFSQFGGNQH